MERIIWQSPGSRFRFRGLPSFVEPLVINRNSRVIDASRVAITPVDNNNLKSIAVSPQQTPVSSTIPSPSRQTVGDFTVDTRIVPYLKPRRLFVEMIGLRPSLNVNVFFDRIKVNAFCIPATLKNNILLESNFVPAGAKGSQLTVDSSGKTYFMFDLPAGTFFGGDRELIVTDISSLASISSASTKASLIYYGFNFSTRPSTIRPVPVPTRIVTARSTPRWINENLDSGEGRGWDPLAQTFFVSSEMTRGTEGFYATKAELYFQTKSSSLGVSVEIREVVNGFPTDIVLPFSHRRLESSFVSTSTNAAAATTFNFASPVFLSSGTEYALVVIPDGANPDYRVWTSEVGGTDVTTSGDVTSNWGEGSLFFSTNGSAWTPIQSEDMKFTLYRAKFNQTTSGSPETLQAKFVNEDYEFFTTTSITGNPVVGEQVFNSSVSTLTGGTTGATTTGSAAVTGTGTTFTTELLVGQPFVVTKGANSAIRNILLINSDTLLTLDAPINFSSTGAELRKGVIGTIEFLAPVANKVRLINSNASAVDKFSAGDVLKTEAGDVLTIASVDNKTVNFFQPSFARQVLNGTSLSLTRDGFYRDTTTFNNSKVELGATNYVVENEMVIKSKSNEGGTKSFTFTSDMTIGLEKDSISLHNTISPSIDQTGIQLTAYANAINNNGTDEYKPLLGKAATKYISKRVSLEDGMDAEDIKVIITGYRPPASDIQIYAKVINSLDPADFDVKKWSRLEQTGGVSVFSDRNNLGDFKEYTYSIASKPTATSLPGSVSVTNGVAAIAGSGTTFTSGIPAITQGSAVLITDPVTGDYQVSRVASVASDTSLTLEENISLSSNSSTTISLVEDPEVAFKNPQNQNIVRYFDSSGASYDTFKMYAVKIVLLSPNNFNIPKVKDLRVISLSV